MTKEIIEEAVTAYAEKNVYWLKLYHFDVDINVFNKLKDEHTEYLKEVYDLHNYQIMFFINLFLMVNIILLNI